MTFPEIWEELTTLFKVGIKQINHPRDGQGYLNKIDYDPTKGVEALEKGVFSADFDAMELINAGRVDIAMDKGLTDYYSFLNQGIVFAPVGVSDSHVDSDPGDARTYIRVDKGRSARRQRRRIRRRHQGSSHRRRLRTLRRSDHRHGLFRRHLQGRRPVHAARQGPGSELDAAGLGARHRQRQASG